MEHYHKMLGGTLDLQTVGADGTPRPAGSGDRIATARLEADAAVIVGSDGHPDYPARMGDATALALRGGDPARLRRIFEGLAAGGRVQMPLSRQPWGGEMGWLIDRYGVNWSVTIDPR